MLCTLQMYTVNALLVTAVTIFFRPLEVRLLIKRGYYSRAVTITNFAFFIFQNVLNLSFLTIYLAKIT